MSTNAPSRIQEYRSDVTPQSVASSRTKSFGSHWIYSLTGVCFLCGGFIAMQLRAFERVQQTRQENVQATALMQDQAERNQRQAEKARQETEAAKRQLKTLQATLASSGNISRKQLSLLNTQIKQLQVSAGLTPVNGPGIRVVMNDNASAAKEGGGPFLPGVVHDFDLLQVVNELRLAGAEAIAINGTRITAYTPIRCVGSPIHINWVPATPPFTIEAIGDPNTLYAALNMPGGILQNLKNPEIGLPLVIKLAKSSRLNLPAASGAATQFKVAKAG